MQNLFGEWETLPEIPLPKAEVEGKALNPRPVALVGGADCRLVLGNDVLGPYALRFEPSRWRVTVEPSRPRASYEVPESDPAFERAVIALTKDPSTDRMLAPVKLRDVSGHELVSAFIVTTARPRSGVSVDAARAAGFERDGTEAERFGLPTTATRQLRELFTYSLERAELSNEVGIDLPTLDGLSKWRLATAVGMLGADVWGHFETTFDPSAEVMVLRRPKMGGDARRRSCSGTSTEESCFELQAENVPGKGLRATATLWRDVPSGGRVYLEAINPDGSELRAPCAFGFNVPPSDRGVSVSQTFPWPELSKAFPACAEALHRASGARLVLFDEGAEMQCAGTCAFAMHPRGRGIVCSCATAPGGGAPGTTERNLHVFRRFRAQELKKQKPTAPEEEPEPEDH